MKRELSVKILNSQKTLVTKEAISMGEVVLKFSGEIKSIPNWQSIQLDEKKHIWPNEEDIWPALNHNCSPNCYVDIVNISLIALRNINAGEELTFDYNLTEYELATPFACNCGNSNCVGVVRGGKFSANKK